MNYHGEGNVFWNLIGSITNLSSDWLTAHTHFSSQFRLMNQTAPHYQSECVDVTHNHIKVVLRGLAYNFSKAIYRCSGVLCKINLVRTRM